MEGDAEHWSQLQGLRRGRLPLEPWLAGLTSGALQPEPELLSALWSQLKRPMVERLLASGAAVDAAPWLAASRQELPGLVAQPAVMEAWLEPLLEHQAQCPAPQARLWLEVLAVFQDPRVAQRLRRVVLEASRLAAEPGASDGELLELVPLLPLLGRQRQRQDAALLLQCALDPGPLAWRRAALEGVALGLSSWPLAMLVPALQRLAEDLSTAIASQALDLLARLPQGQRHLRAMRTRPLDPAVAERLQRRLQCTPLVLVVHGRQGGAIPDLYGALAQELSLRRGAPVLLQALTAEVPLAEAGFWLAAQRANGITVVPLLLLPGEHVRRDLPALVEGWRTAAATALPVGPIPNVGRRPFLGAWPAWQALVADLVQQVAAGRPHAWLHHPLQGELAQRFLSHLRRVFGQSGVPAVELGQALRFNLDPASAALLVPYGLAPSRTAESLNMEGVVPPAWEVLPPLLELPSVRTFLLDRLEVLP